jgi:hypothetical protein
MFKELAKKKGPPPNASTQAKPAEITRLEFTKLSAKRPGTKKTYDVGIRTGSEDVTLKLPGRSISEVLAYMIPGGTHWWLEFVADCDPMKTEKGTDSPVKKLVKVDLTDKQYRVIYNANPDHVDPSATYIFKGVKPTVQDVVRLVADIAQDKGKWTKDGYNCRGFVEELISRLGTLPALILTKRT